jgi:hypothetical protein
MDSNYDSDASYWCHTSRGYPCTAPSKPEDDDNDDNPSSFSENGSPNHCNPNPTPSELDDDDYQGPTPPESNHHNKWESKSEVNKGYEPEGLNCKDDDDEVQTDDEEHTHGGMDSSKIQVLENAYTEQSLEVLWESQVQYGWS